MTDQRVVTVSRDIDATPEAVFQALTHPLELSFWLCHHARMEPMVGGEFRFRWRNGWWARGTCRMVERPRRIELTWQGKDEPGETDLVFEIEALDQGTAIKVIHSGYGADAAWDKAVVEAEKSWPQALQNLESVLTTGVDLREARRPRLGIVPMELTPERAASEDLAVHRGIYLASVLENGGAAEAGLQKGDVVTSIGGMAVIDWDSLITTLAPYQAGDLVSVGYVRGQARGTVEVELKPQAMPEISTVPQEVVQRAREMKRAALTDLRQAVKELPEEEAETRPSVDDWSVKEALAHLSLNERFTQRWFADIIVGTSGTQHGGNPTILPELLTMTLTTAPTVGALLDRLEKDMEETLALFSALRPEIAAMKARYRTMAGALLRDFHIRDHLNQIEATIEAVKERSRK